MKISPNHKVRSVVGENFVIIQGASPSETSKVIALNATSMLLWNELNGKDFELADVVRILTDHFEVEAAVAEKDATQWIETFKTHGVII